MKRILGSVILMLVILMAVGCKSTPDSSSSEEEATCSEPQNPFDEGSGHYAGFEWAAEHNGTCETSSTSFNEGCDEYETQEDRYTRCEARRR
jgi:hypothetical protein